MRRKLEEEGGRPVFLIADHYGVASQLNFYIPEARASADEQFLAYTRQTGTPRNQYFFWPGYTDERQGQNALYVRELSPPPLVDKWFSKWLAGELHPNLVRHPPVSRPPPPQLLEQFETVTDLGQIQITRRTRTMRTFQVFECRNLK
jgi:hypothetical protein